MADPPIYIWTPTRKIRYIIRHGEKILQQLWKTQQPPETYDSRFPDNYEFRDVPLELEEAAHRGFAPGEGWVATRFLRYVNKTSGDRVLQQLWKLRSSTPNKLQWMEIPVVEQDAR